MVTTMKYRMAFFSLVCVTFSIFSIIGCDGGSNELEKARKRAQTVEAELKRLKEKNEDLNKEKQQLKEVLYDNIDNNVKLYILNLEKRIDELESLVPKLPRALIKDVKIDSKKKKVNISVIFDIYNRKGIEGSVKLYFYRQDGKHLKKNNRQIIIDEKFTPKRVVDTSTVEFLLSDVDLSVKQPRTLQFRVKIYDEPTNSFLNQDNYLNTFDFDPL